MLADLRAYQPGLRAERRAPPRAAAHAGLARGGAAARAEERPAARAQQRAAEPAADLRDRRGDGRRRQPVPPLGDGQRRPRSTASTDGSAVVDGLGLVGRIAGVGERSARIIFLNDASSRVPAVVRPSGQRAMVAGDNGPAPALEFIDQADELRPGDRVVSSGDGGLYPPDILIGQVVVGPDGRQRVRLAADYRRLDFVRVVRAVPADAGRRPGRADRAAAGGAAGAPRRAGSRANDPAARPAAARPRSALLLGLGFVAVQAALIPLGPGGAAGAAGPALRPRRRLGDPPPGHRAALGGAGARPLRRRDAVAPARPRRARAAARHRGVPRRARRLPRRALPARVAGAAAPASRRCSPGCSWRWRSSSPTRRGSAALLRYLLATALAYPLVVLGLTWCLGLRAPRAARRFGDRAGAAAVKREPDAAGAADHPPRR